MDRMPATLAPDHRNRGVILGHRITRAARNGVNRGTATVHSPLTTWPPLACGVALSLTTSDARADEGGVGYCNQQLSGDSGACAVLGDIKSSTYAIGPQAGCFFPVGSAKGYVSLRGYGEFATDHRPEGWNVWLIGGLPFGTRRFAPSAQRLLRALG